MAIRATFMMSTNPMKVKSQINGTANPDRPRRARAAINALMAVNRRMRSQTVPPVIWTDLLGQQQAT